MRTKSEIDIPEGVNVAFDGFTLNVSGPKGKVTIKLPSAGKIEGRKIILSVASKEVFNTTAALIKAAFKGVLEGYTRKMKMIFAHFPMTIEIKGKEIYIKNFLGERVSRVADIVGSTSIKSDKEFVTISGSDKYSVGQTVANIKTATKIKNKDPRTFQDGLYEIYD